MRKTLLVVNWLFASSVLLGMHNTNESSKNTNLSQRALLSSDTITSDSWFNNIKNQNHEQIKSAIKSDINIDAQDDEGNTALMISIRNGDESMVRLLLDNGADFDLRNTEGKTSINLATDLAKGTIKGIGSKKAYKRIKSLIDQAQKNTKFRSKTEESSISFFETMYTFLKKNNVRDVEQMILSNPNSINYRFRNDKHSMLIYAVRRGKEFHKMLKMLLRQPDINLEIQTIEGYTALMFAVENNYREAITELLKHKNCNINATDIYQNTALLLATYENNVEVVKLLLQNKDIDINISNIEEVSPLRFALQHNYVEIANMILELKDRVKAGLESPSLGGKTLIDAVRRNLTDETDQILSICDKNVNYQDQNDCTPLMFAASENNREMVKLLLKHGADINIQNKAGHSALSIALQKGFGDIAMLMLSNPQNLQSTSLDVNMCTQSGITLLMLSASQGLFDIANYLSNHPQIDINQTNMFGHTALWHAVISGDEDIVEVLLKKYNKTLFAKEIDRKDWLDHTIWETAVCLGNTKILKLLLDTIPERASKQNKIKDLNELLEQEEKIVEDIEKNKQEQATQEEKNFLINQSFIEEVSVGSIKVKSFLNLKDNENNKIISQDSINKALRIAIQNGNLEIIKLLIPLKPDINLKDDEGNTPLILAAEHNQLHVMPTLISNGANINAKNKEGFTALIIAAKNAHIEICRLLTKKFKARLFVKDNSGKTVFDIVNDQINKLMNKKFRSEQDKEKISTYKSIQKILEVITKNNDDSIIISETKDVNAYWPIHVCSTSQKQLDTMRTKNKVFYDKILLGLNLLRLDPFDKSWGNPEKLESGLWSRKLNDKNRLVYDINGEEVLIVSCANHYPNDINKKPKKSILKGVKFYLWKADTTNIRS